MHARLDCVPLENAIGVGGFRNREEDRTCNTFRGSNEPPERVLAQAQRKERKSMKPRFGRELEEGELVDDTAQD